MCKSVGWITIFLSFFLVSYRLDAQSDTYTIRNIEITGNDKTLDYIILRELSFRKGDTIELEKLSSLFEKAKRQLDYMGLFASAEFFAYIISPEEKVLDIILELKERWFIYPVPMLELADRNFNVWWKDYHHSLRRINYGLKLYHLNLTGRNDEAKAKVQIGFSQKYELKYSLPSFRFIPDWGLEMNTLYGLEKEVRYKTIAHHEHFMHSEENVLYKRFRLGGALVYRNKLYHRFKVKLNYHKNKIDDSVFVENPNFLGANKTSQRYFTLGADWSYDNRDNRVFSTRGSLFHFEGNRYGLHKNHDLSYWDLLAYANGAQPLSERMLLRFEVRSRWQFTPDVLPYTERRALNWGDVYLEGYEYFLLDGTDYALAKIRIYYSLLKMRLLWGGEESTAAYKNLDFEFYIGFLGTTGYFRDNNRQIKNYLTDELLYSAGPEVKVLFNKFILGSGQVVINHLGQIGLYLRADVAFSF